MTALITGGSGFIGSHFVDLCLSKGISVINWDAMKTGSMPEHGPLKRHSLYLFEKIDLTQEFTIPNVDMIIHFAAETHVDRSIEDSLSFVESNIIGTYNLLRKSKNVRLHLVSTDEVYGDVSGLKRKSTELDTICASSPYSASKASSEQLVIAWGHTYGLDYTITRGCNTIGARQNKEKLFPKFIYNAENDLSLPVYGDGKAIRQYIHVSDHVSGIFEVVTRAKSGSIYNLCADVSYSINEIVDFLRGYFPNLTTTEENRLGHDLKYNIDNAQIVSDLGWAPLITGKRILQQSFEEISYNLI